MVDGGVFDPVGQVGMLHSIEGGKRLYRLCGYQEDALKKMIDADKQNGGRKLGHDIINELFGVLSGNDITQNTIDVLKELHVLGYIECIQIANTSMCTVRVKDSARSYFYEKEAEMAKQKVEKRTTKVWDIVKIVITVLITLLIQQLFVWTPRIIEKASVLWHQIFP